jgi:hypothetical protein
MFDTLLKLLKSSGDFHDEIDCYLSTDTEAVNDKGAPAWESRTGGRLVSPARSLQKKKRKPL